MKLPLSISLFAFIFAANNLYASVYSDSLWRAYGNTSTSVSQFTTLDALWKYYAVNKEKKQQDSVVAIALDVATMQQKDTAAVAWLNKYFEYPISDTARGSEYAGMMDGLASNAHSNEWHYYTFLAKAKLALAKNSPAIACQQMEKAFQAVSYTGNEVMLCACLLYKGHCLEENNQKLEAFSHYLQGIYLADKLENKQLLFTASGYLSAFYSYVKNGTKAEEYKIRQLKILASAHPVDSLAYMQCRSGLADIYFKSGKHDAGKRIIYAVIDFADRRHAAQLKDDAFVIYRSFLIENNEMQQLSLLYERDYPGELADMAKDDSIMYWRIAAFISEFHGNSEQADHYYRQVERTMASGQSSAAISSFYKRYGQFLLRRNQISGALSKFDSSYIYALKAGYLPFVVEATHYLDSLNYLSGNVAAAYTYAQLKQQYSDQLDKVRKADELLLSELDYSVKQSELQEQRRQDETRRRHNLQYMGIVITLFTSFIVLALFGMFRVHKLVIRTMGFFSFIFFFEFIILIADNWIHHATHGEPWKVIVIKIFLIGALLPFHHWLEEKVVHYLSHHKLIDSSKLSLKGLFGKQMPPVKKVVKEEVEG